MLDGIKCNCGLDLRKGNRGLGPDSFGCIRHLLPYHKEFHIPARGHDIGYSLGLKDRKEIDKKFLELMLKINTGKPFAYLYYASVRLGGFIFYNPK